MVAAEQQVGYLEQAEEPVAVEVPGVPAQQKAACRKRIRLNIWVSVVRFCLFSLCNNDAVASAKAPQMPETFNPDLFVAKWYCSKVLPEDMPQFAADALEAGYDGLALRRLASLMRPTSRDVGDLFERVLREIGTVKVQSKEQ